MANEYAVNAADLTAVAAKIREKAETAGVLQFPGGFVSAIDAISGQAVAFDFSGKYEIKTDPDGNWEIYFLTGGTFVPKKDYEIDVFVVGAGGGGNLAGGGGGYVQTIRKVQLVAGQECEIVIGQGVAGEKGGTTYAFGAQAEGGEPATDNGIGGNGSSGGGAWANGSPAGNGGENGSDGEKSGAGIAGGTGNKQPTTAFGDGIGIPYGPGGGGGDYGAGKVGRGGSYGGGSAKENSAGEDGKPNTGSGGGGKPNVNYPNSKGGNGIAIIRNSR